MNESKLNRIAMRTIIFAVCMIALLIAIPSKSQECLFSDSFECGLTVPQSPVLTVTPQTIEAGEQARLDWILPSTGSCRLTGPTIDFSDADLREVASTTVTAAADAKFELICGESATASLTVNHPPPPPIPEPLMICADQGSPFPIFTEWEQLFAPWGFGGQAKAKPSFNSFLHMRLEFEVLAAATDPSDVLVTWVDNPASARNVQIGVRECLGPPNERPGRSVCTINSPPPGGAISMGLNSSICPLKRNTRYALTLWWRFPDRSSSCDLPSGICTWDPRTFGAGAKTDACGWLEGRGLTWTEGYRDWCEGD